MLEKAGKKIENIALFDLDGTLCDYEGALRRDMDKIKEPREFLFGPFFGDNLPDYLKQRIDMIRRQPGWWKNLEKFKLGFDVLEEARKQGFEVYILTKDLVQNQKLGEKKQFG